MSASDAQPPAQASKAHTRAVVQQARDFWFPYSELQKLRERIAFLGDRTSECDQVIQLLVEVNSVTLSSIRKLTERVVALELEVAEQGKRRQGG